MIAISQNLINEFSAEEYSPVVLVEMYFDTTLYFTSLDTDIFYSGNWYLSRGLSFDEIFNTYTPELDILSFEIDNVGLEFSGFVTNQELRRRAVNIYIAAMDANLHIIGTVLAFLGVIDTIEGDHQRVRIDLLNHFYLWNKKTLRSHSPLCQWAFTSTECGYLGPETWCDKTYDRCTVLANIVNYGGFPFLPSLINKQIRWGHI